MAQAKWFLGLALLASVAAASAELQLTGEVVTAPSLLSRPWRGVTLALTANQARTVDWTLGPATRTGDLLALPGLPRGLETRGDTALVHLEVGDSWRVYPFGNLLRVDTVAPNWHLPNTSIGGVPYRIVVEPDFYLAILTAPGPGTILSLLDFGSVVGPADAWGFGGDRAVLGNALGLHVADLSQTVYPVLTAAVEPPEPGWRPTGIVVADRLVHAVWGGRLQAYDLTDAVSPSFVGDAPCARSQLAGAGRWLVAYDEGQTGVSVFEVDAAAGPRLVGSWDLAFPVAGPVQIHGDVLVVQDPTGLHGYAIAPDEVTDRGLAWTVIAADAMAAGAGRAWLLADGRRYGVSYVGTPRLLSDEVPGEVTGLVLVGDLLFTALVHTGVRIDEVVSGGVPGLRAVVAAPAALAALDVRGDLLAMAHVGGASLVDVSDPSAPGAPATLALVGQPVAVSLLGSVAVVSANQTAGPGLVHVLDLVDPAAPRLAASVPADWQGYQDWRVGVGVPEGTVVRILCVRDTGSGFETRFLAVDTADPDLPEITWSGADPGFWCYRDDGTPVAHLRPVALGPHHVAFRGLEVTVASGPAGLLVPLATWSAPGEITALAAVGNQLLVASAGRLSALTFSDASVVAAPVLDPATGVCAAPNPFNPRAEIAFELARAGQAEVRIFDVRGRQVRCLDGRFPGGPVRLTWDGTDQAGRDLPSGQYLLRVRTAAGVRSGRCTLVR
ncbi:MAG: FlgD immunoglobulin-like domain containing protein [Candidatus Krumholzibacteriia bacterium]